MLIGLADRVTRRMRATGRTGRTVVLRLRFADYSAATRSRTLHAGTSSSGPVLAAARALLAEAAPTVAARGLTLIGITVANLDGESRRRPARRCRWRTPPAPASTRPSTRCATASAPPR